MEKKRILILDDKKENINAYKATLKENYPEFKPTYAYSEKEGLYLLDKKQKYDLVITDRIMEDEFSGHRIIDKCIDNLIPAFMITEWDHSGKLSSISPVLTEESFGEYMYRGAKKDPETIYGLMQKIFETNSSRIYTHILFKTIGKALEQYDNFVGERSEEVNKLIDRYKEPLFAKIHKGNEYLEQKK
jgi:DNA-binding NtrC family response regulator